jgi:outer membrane lipoprotein-sorting protein
MKFRKLLFMILPVFLFTGHLKLSAQDVDEIIRKTDDKSRGEYAEQEMKMSIIRPDWTRSVSLKMWSKGTDYALILITAPAKEKGQVFLKRSTEMWNWVPSIERMIKIPPSMMMQSWMGSDFTNDDLVKESSMVNDYTKTLLGHESIDGADCWKIQLVPNPEAAVVWGKVISWIDKDYNQRKAEYYDEDGTLINTMVLSDIKKMDDRVIPTHMEMVPADEENKKTIIEISSAVYNKPIPESFFSIQNMKTVR